MIYVYFLIAGFHKVEFPIFGLHRSETYQVSSFHQIFVCCFSYCYSLPYTSIYSYVVTHQQIGASSVCALSCACN